MKSVKLFLFILIQTGEMTVKSFHVSIDKDITNKQNIRYSI